MDLKERKKYYNLCDPYRSDIDEKYIMDIDGFEIDGQKVYVRGENWADDIVTQISWSNEPQIVYFTGYTGSGKTTELKHIIKRLEREDEGNLLPVYINFIDYFDITQPLDLSDIFTVIVYNIIKEVGKYQGKSEAQMFGENDYFGRLWHWLKTTNLSIENFEIESNGATIPINLKETPEFRRHVKQTINDNFSKFKTEVLKEIDRLNELVKRYEKDGKRKDGILVVIDQLEKNRGTSSNVDEVKESIERVFANRDNLMLPIDVIYTIPPYLSVKRSIGDISFLPVVRVINKNDTPNFDGITVMKEFICKRIPKEALIEIFGDDYEMKLEKIVVATGGYPRDLLKIMQSVITQKSYPVSNIEFILQELDNEFQEFLIADEEYKEELKAIYIKKELISNRDILYELFSSHAILRYRNGKLWYTLHPSVKKLLEI